MFAELVAVTGSGDDGWIGATAGSSAASSSGSDRDLRGAGRRGHNVGFGGDSDCGSCADPFLVSQSR